VAPPVEIEDDYRGCERSLNLRSTASTVDLGFILPSHHHYGLGLDQELPQPVPLPLSIGMWAGSFSPDGRIEEESTQGGTQKVGGPHGASRK